MPYDAYDAYRLFVFSVSWQALHHQRALHSVLAAQTLNASIRVGRGAVAHQALSHLCFRVGRGAVAHQARADALYALILIDSWRPWCSCSSSPLALVFSCRPWRGCSSSPLRCTIWRSCSSSPPTLVYSCRPWCSCSSSPLRCTICSYIHRFV